MISANITNAYRKAVYRRDGYQCALCSNTKTLQIHHAVPRSHGGSDTPHNLVTLCAWCHARAHDGLADDADIMSQEDVEQAIVEYLADYYAPDWWPYKAQNPDETGQYILP